MKIVHTRHRARFTGFWVIGLFALLWNASGVTNFIMQSGPEMLAQMAESHRVIAETRPLWVTVAFAVSVIPETLSGLLLLLKMKLAYPLFAISLVVAHIATLHRVVMGEALATFSAAEIGLANVGPIVLGAFLTWYTKYVVQRIPVSMCFRNSVSSICFRLCTQLTCTSRIAER